MQACGDVMIGLHGRSVHEAIPHTCGAKAIPTSLFHHHYQEIISQSIKPTVKRLSYIFHDFSIRRDPHLLTVVVCHAAHFLDHVCVQSTAWFGSSQNILRNLQL